MKQTAIRLPDDTFYRLQELSKQTGRTTTYYIREAIQEHLDDLEDIYLSQHALEQLNNGKDTVVGSKEFWRGLDD